MSRDGGGFETITRREYNERFGQPAPELDIPEGGEHLWDWFMDLSHRIRRVVDGTCGPIPPTEFIAWREATGHIVYPWEYDILCSMDIAFCDETNKELAARNEAEAEEAAARAKRGK